MFEKVCYDSSTSGLKHKPFSQKIFLWTHMYRVQKQIKLPGISFRFCALSDIQSNSVTPLFLTQHQQALNSLQNLYELQKFFQFYSLNAGITPPFYYISTCVIYFAKEVTCLLRKSFLSIYQCPLLSPSAGETVVCRVKPWLEQRVGQEEM